MKYEHITPDQFWKEYFCAFKTWWHEDNSKKLKSFKYNKKWTLEIMSFLLDFGRDLGYYPDYEWLSRIDVSYFSKSDLDWSEWSCEVAIEHENDGIVKSREECSKFTSVNAGLKVLITYYGEQDDLKSYLKDFKRIYDSRKYHQNDDSYVFIFSPNEPALNIGKDCVVYKFENKQISLITDNAMIFTGKGS